MSATLDAVRERKYLIEESPPEPLAITTSIRMLRGARTVSGKIVPAGRKGRILSEYEDEGETGWLVDFGREDLRCVRVPVSSGLALPLKEAGL